MNCQGKLMIKPLEARITRNTEWFGKMDPFVQFQFQNQRQCSSVCKAGGTNPFWNDILTFNKMSGHLLFITVLDHETMKMHDVIGTLEIDVSDIFVKTQSTTKWVDVIYDAKVSASLRIELFFQPMTSQIQNQNNFSGGGSVMNSKRSKHNQMKNNQQQQYQPNQTYDQYQQQAPQSYQWQYAQQNFQKKEFSIPQKISQILVQQKQQHFVVNPNKFKPPQWVHNAPSVPQEARVSNVSQYFPKKTQSNREQADDEIMPQKKMPVNSIAYSKNQDFTADQMDDLLK